jgi:hypothetical protein
LTLLIKGLKYNLNHKHKNWIKTLASEAETAITQVPIFEQDYIRCQVAHNIERYKQQEVQYTLNTIPLKKEKKKTVNEVKEKLNNQESSGIKS